MVNFWLTIAASTVSTFVTVVVGFIVHARNAHFSRIEKAAEHATEQAAIANNRCARIEGFLSVYGYKPEN